MDAFSLTFSSTRIINFFVISFNQRKRRPLLIALPSFFTDCNKWISVIAAAVLSNISIKNQSKLRLGNWKNKNVSHLGQ